MAPRNQGEASWGFPREVLRSWHPRQGLTVHLESMSEKKGRVINLRAVTGGAGAPPPAQETQAHHDEGMLIEFSC